VTLRQTRFLFVTDIDGWGGSEELWSRSAADLADQGFAVFASVVEGSLMHPRVRELAAHGVELWVRPVWYSWRQDFWRWFVSWRLGTMAHAVKSLIEKRSPSLVVLSGGGAFLPIELLEFCAGNAVPFVTIAQANRDEDWCRDDLAERYRNALAAARRCFFVSRANLRLAEKQIGGELPNAKVVWNPVNVAMNASPAWPGWGRDDEWRFACVGRLHPPSKGQDILLEVLARPSWRERRWRLRLYGDGNMRRGIEHLAQRLGLIDRVIFAGVAPVAEIWAANHVLIMPSRYEGLPLAIVEAMLCARPIVATDVAGNAEVIEDGVTGFLADAPTVESVATALEKFWTRRGDAEQIGQAGARMIRRLLPSDPVRTFSNKLKEIALTAI
jgi:glycosyltransferase involved in cell wall biosynthesis